MILSEQDLIRRILETKAVSIWNHKTGPIFWYANGTPGPFYVNTEKVLGGTCAAHLLEGITSIVENVPEGHTRAQKLEPLIIEAYKADAFYQNLIETMAAKTESVFAKGSFSFFSGGERRDWLFSIPLAIKMGVPHIYLFKNGESFCVAPFAKGDGVVHVSDLINNAASHFDSWFPILEKHGLTCPGSVCVNTRGTNGLMRLAAANHKIAALNGVTLPFFENCCKSGLIEAATVKEIGLFFDDPKAWASAYVMSNPKLFDVATADKKSLARIKTFIQTDPWKLRSAHEAFFAQIEDALAKRAA